MTEEMKESGKGRKLGFEEKRRGRKETEKGRR